MASDSRLRDPRVEPLDPRPPASDAYLHRAARVAVLLAIPALTHAHALPQLRSNPRRSTVNIERLAPRQVSSRKDFAWRAAVPQGVSAPVAAAERVFVTGRQDGELALLCLDAATGDELWRRQPQDPRAASAHGEKLVPRRQPPAPAPASDGSAVFAFFPRIGLLAYSLDGDELWRAPLESFAGAQAVAASPVYAEGRVVLLADRADDAVLAAFDAASGRQLWRQDLPGDPLDRRSAPALYRPANGPAQVIAADGAGETAFRLDTGEPLWRRQGRIEAAASNALPQAMNDAVNEAVHDFAAGSGESVQAPPAMAGSRLYVRTDQALYCFGEPG